MIILGSTSEVAQAFVEKALTAGEKFPKIYLVTSSRETTERFAQHIDVKFLQPSEIIELDLTQEINYSVFENVDSDLLFCATGYLGLGTEDGLYDDKNTEKIIDINYAKLVPVINYFAKKMESKRSGNIIALSSVAGDRGRQSKFIYGYTRFFAITLHCSSFTTIVLPASTDGVISTMINWRIYILFQCFFCQFLSFSIQLNQLALF
jgi:NADP-dependent 3-hydroxy acid dehydrogenase YdfG